MPARSCSFLVLLAFILLANHAAAQTPSGNWPPKDWPHNAKNCFHLLSNTYQCNWINFTIKKPLEGTIVSYDADTKDSKNANSISVAIVKTANDTVRVLHNGTYNLKAGDKVKFTAANEPEHDVFAPIDRNFYLEVEKKGHNPICRINRYDNQVLRTTWGKVAKN